MINQNTTVISLGGGIFHFFTFYFSAMRKQIVFLSFILLATFSLNGQIAQNSVNTFNDISFFVSINNKKYRDAKGTKYIDDKFILSKINNFEKLYPVRFDVVDNIMEFKEADQEIMGISPTQDFRIVFSDGSNRVFTSKTIINETGDLQRLFLEEVQVTQNYSLYKRTRIKFHPAKPAKSSYEPEVPAIFKKMSDFFYVDYPNDSIDYLLLLPKNKKKVKLFFGTHGNEVIKYAKKEGLKFDSQEAIIKILNYYAEIR